MDFLVKEHYSPKRIILDKKIKATYFSINDKSKHSLNWDIEIHPVNSSKKIKGSIIESNSFRKIERALLDKLRDKAITESKTDASIYQIIFIESLRAKGLRANASYYLDLFIEVNNNQKLINYKKYNSK